MARKKIEKVKINNLQLLAEQYLSNQTPDEEIKNQDITDIFLYELLKTIENGEIVNIQILGEVRTGKSTLACKIWKEINEYYGNKLSFKYFAHEQIEFGNMVYKDSKLSKCCIWIDEWSELGKTNLNATTEDAQLKTFSDIQAVRLIHRISCSPRVISDANANIILKVWGKNEKTKTTRVKVYYRTIEPYGTIVQLIGFADIYVGDVLEMPFYKKYLKRKINKIQIINQEGIADTRPIENAKMIKRCYGDLRQLAIYGKINREIIRNYIEKVKREQKKFLSILANEDIVQKVYGMLVQEREIHNLIYKRKMLEKKGVDKYILENLDRQIDTLRNILQDILIELDNVIAVEDKINLKYDDNKDKKRNIYKKKSNNNDASRLASKSGRGRKSLSTSSTFSKSTSIHTNPKNSRSKSSKSLKSGGKKTKKTQKTQKKKKVVK